MRVCETAFHRKSLHKTALLMSSILAVGFATPAFGQAASNIPVPVPSVRETVDAAGVDLATGSVNFELANVSIGNGEDSLNFERTYASPTTYEDNVLGQVVSGTNTLSIVLNGETEIFNVSGAVYTPKEPTGSTLTYSNSAYIYTKSDGSIARYGACKTINLAQSSCNQPQLSQYTDANGLTRTYNYEDSAVLETVISTLNITVREKGSRIKSIKNNAGLELKLEYFKPATDKFAANSGSYNNDWWNLKAVIARNTNIDACTTDGCTPASTRPSVTIATPSAGVTTYTDAFGYITTVTKTATGVSVRTPGKAADNMVYTTNTAGRVEQSAVNGVLTYYYSADLGGIRTVVRTVVQDISGLYATETFKFYIPNSQLTEYTDRLNNKTTYTYNAARLLTNVAYPEGNSVAYTYDARGNVTQTVSFPKAGSGASIITTSASFPATCTNTAVCNKPIWTKDGKGNQTDYTYNTMGMVTSVKSPADAAGVRPETRLTYAAQTATTGTITKLTEVSSCSVGATCAGTADETKTVVTYGTVAQNNMRPASITTKSGNNAVFSTTVVTYNVTGDVETVDGPLPGADDTTRMLYDVALRRPKGTISPDPDGAGVRTPIATRITYDSQMRPTLTEAGTVPSGAVDLSGFTAAQASETIYDTNDRAIESRLKSGATVHSVSQNNYDSAGRVNCTVQRMDLANPGTAANACIPQTAGANGPDRVTKYTYDTNDRPVKMQTAFGVASTQADEVAITYTANGKQQSVKDAEGNLTTYVYDGHDRLSQTRYPSPTKGAGTSSATDYEQITYDANSNATQRRLRDGQVINFVFDNLNRVITKDLPDIVYDVSYSYDLLGRMKVATTGTTTNSPFINLGYDALGRVTSTSALINGALNYTYDAAGRRTSVTYPGTVPLTVNYDYDVTGNMTRIRENGATSGAGILANYAYDSLGRRASITFGNGTVKTYTYDAASRLASLGVDLAGTASDQTAAFTYNPASQIAGLSKTNDAYAWTGHYNVDRPYTANGLNQQTIAGTVALTYDAKGNLSQSGSNVYTYTAENQLRLLAGVFGLSYDPAGRLLKTSTPTVATHFGYDGANLIAEYDTARVLTRRYVHGPGDDEAFLWYEGAGLADKRYLMSDERGSITSVTDGAGAILGINRYDEYGIPAATNIGRFQYTGQTWLPEIGMYNYKARMYSPTLGRFMQTDPIGYGDGMNWYDYVGSDPVNGRDPSGMKASTGKSGCSPAVEGEIVACGSPVPQGGGGGIIFWDRTAPIVGPDQFGGGGGGRGAAPAAPTPEPVKDKKEEQCIAPTAGPVKFWGGAFELAPIVGAGFSYMKFSIPSIRVSGRAASGSALVGVGANLGGFYGEVDKYSNFVGDGIQFSAGVKGPLGVTILTDRSGNKVGWIAGLGAGGGAYGGLTKTKNQSSTQSVCK